MRYPEDDFTATVDGAAAYARWHAEADYYPDDLPDLSDVIDDSAEIRAEIRRITSALGYQPPAPREGDPF